MVKIKMPVPAGVEATRQIKSFRSHLPIVAVTAHALTGDRFHFLQSGCDDYLAKPFLETDVINLLKKFKVI
jgi:CheY-like chemotaxis protein